MKRSIRHVLEVKETRFSYKMGSTVREYRGKYSLSALPVDGEQAV